ncbi:MAG TPA: S1-like domain-containing RNA-binding protein [Puia sp.]|nr:S1-like domain-containing RNA-binding protein [Puia sp.]
MAIRIGEYNRLKVIKEKPMGVFLDDGEAGLLLPRRFVPANTKIGDELNVFVYHDGEGRPIATTQKPLGVLGDIAKLKAVSVTPQGAFLDWGLMKDLFIPKSAMVSFIQPTGEYLVKIVMDEQTGRLAATEKLDHYLSNDHPELQILQEVDLIAYRKTDIGWLVIINNQYTGVLHFNEIYRSVQAGDRFTGFIKNISPDNKIDVVAGKPGYQRVEDESEKILRLLKEHNGYLPYYDKSSPEEIYSFFGMSKKAFKMATGNLYKQRLIRFTKNGIQVTGE